MIKLSFSGKVVKAFYFHRLLPLAKRSYIKCIPKWNLVLIPTSPITQPCPFPILQQLHITVTETCAGERLLRRQWIRQSNWPYLTFWPLMKNLGSVLSSFRKEGTSTGSHPWPCDLVLHQGICEMEPMWVQGNVPVSPVMLLQMKRESQSYRLREKRKSKTKFFFSINFLKPPEWLCGITAAGCEWCMKWKIPAHPVERKFTDSALQSLICSGVWCSI